MLCESRTMSDPRPKAGQPTEGCRPIPEPSQELLAAIGAMAVEAAKLDYWLASLVMHLDGLSDDEARQLLGKPGGPRRRLREQVEGGAEPADELMRILRGAEAALDSRNYLLHAVAMVEEVEGEESRIVWWHPRTGEDLEEVTVPAVLEHTHDISRLMRRIGTLTLQLAPDD